MANLYLTEQCSVLKKTGDLLIVEKDKEVLLDVQCSKIEAVLMFGSVQFTTKAISGNHLCPFQRADSLWANLL